MSVKVEIVIVKSSSILKRIVLLICYKIVELTMLMSIERENLAIIRKSGRNRASRNTLISKAISRII